MKFIPSSQLLRTSLFLTTSLAAIPAHAAVLTNGSFESGTSGWTVSGGSGLFTTVSQLSGGSSNVNPVAGAAFAVVSNNGVASAAVSQTFDITAAGLFLSYRFLTDEYNTGAGYNDFATITLTVAGNPTTLATIARNGLQAGGEGSLLAGASFIDNTESGFDIGQSAWQNLAVDVSSYLGQSATLTFQVNNVGGSDLDIGVSQLAFDRVIVAVPEPGSSVILVTAMGLMAARRRR
jgi:hypothetical protein